MIIQIDEPEGEKRPCLRLILAHNEAMPDNEKLKGALWTAVQAIGSPRGQAMIVVRLPQTEEGV